MWIAQDKYVALIDKAARAETRADWLMARVNQLELDNAQLRHDVTGKPVAVPMFRKEATDPIDDAAETSFEDLGDTLARRHGVDWDQRVT